jgi:hypothetical protein
VSHDGSVEDGTQKTLGEHPPPRDEVPIIPIGGFESMWGVLMAAKSDDPAEQREIKRQRRRLAIWIGVTVVFVALILTGGIAVHR